MKRRQSREGVKERFVGQIADPPQREGAPELLRQLLDSAAGIASRGHVSCRSVHGLYYRISNRCSIERGNYSVTTPAIIAK